MAGNIIPAIATTNAIIAGLIVLESLKILSGQIESCRTVGCSTPGYPFLALPLPPSLVQPSLAEGREPSCPRSLKW